VLGDDLLLLMESVSRARPDLDPCNRIPPPPFARIGDGTAALLRRLSATSQPGGRHVQVAVVSFPCSRQIREPKLMCCRRPLILASVVAVAALSLLAAACGGGALEVLRGSPPPRLPPRLPPRRRCNTARTAKRTPERSPSPAACAHTGYRTGPTPSAMEGSTSRSCGNSLSASPGCGRSRGGPAITCSTAAMRGRSRPPIGLTTSGPPHASAGTDFLTSPTRYSRTECQVQHPLEHRHELSPGQERGGDLRQTDTGGSALQQIRRFLSGLCRRAGASPPAPTPQRRVMVQPGPGSSRGGSWGRLVGF
jgi:hypothetical protein